MCKFAKLSHRRRRESTRSLRACTRNSQTKLEITEGHQSEHVNMEEMESVTVDEISYTDQTSLTRINVIIQEERNKRE